MHPQRSDKKLVCREFFEALEKCHEVTWLNKVLGICNKEKEDLNKCLRAERTARTEAHWKASKERNLKIVTAKQEFYKASE